MNNSGHFADRREAGRLLADKIAQLALTDVVVLALPRGGVPVAYEIAKRIHAPLDILIVRKIGAPGHEEYGIGAVVDGNSPQLVIDEHAARMVGADEAYLKAELTRQLAEIERRRSAYHVGPPVPLAGKTVIVVDDGIATGGTVSAALKALAKVGPARLLLAVPVAPRTVVYQMADLVERVICLSMPEPFYAVGAHYADFGQTPDSEVIHLLKEARLATE